MASTNMALASKPEPKARSYKDFLTPAMHRRFTSATTGALILCYIEAVVMSDGNLFWRFFVLGRPGIRMMLLFLSVLSVFIVRLANLHVGERNTTSGVETLYQHLTAARTYNTLWWYLVSAFVFGEVYIWSRGNDANLGWIDKGRHYERPRLNENPIVLRSLYMYLAAVQTCVHLYSERDTVSLLKTEENNKQGSSAVTQSVRPIDTLKQTLPTIAQRSFKLTILGLVTIMPIYLLLLRRTAWSWTYFFGRIFFRDLPKTSTPAGFVHLPGLIWQSGSSCFMMIFLWELSNAVFTLYVAQPPLKKDNPLTSETKDNAGSYVTKSQDPNGSLLNGLKSKKEVPKTFAFWELYLICTRFDARRKTIFNEVDRRTGSTWVQMSTACLNEIEAIRSRIRASQDPVEGRAKMAAEELARKQQEHLIGHPQTEPMGLPSIANRGVQDGEVFAKQASSFAQNVGALARSVGQSPNAQNPLTPRAMRALEWGTDRVLSKEQQAQLSKQALGKETNAYVLSFLQTPVGEPFRKTFARLANAVIFGIPRSNRVNIVHAIRSLTSLILASLKEDDYGQAAKDVPAIIRTYTATIGEIQRFLAVLEPSWTDVEFNASKSRQVRDISDVVQELRNGLEQMLLAFGEYAGSLGLNKREVREAKEAVGKGLGSEMVQTR
jgi:nucleoporin NDC1